MKFLTDRRRSKELAEILGEKRYHTRSDVIRQVLESRLGGAMSDGTKANLAMDIVIALMYADRQNCPHLFALGDGFCFRCGAEKPHLQIK